jgi:hypothetical protein
MEAITSLSARALCRRTLVEDQESLAAVATAALELASGSLVFQTRTHRQSTNAGVRFETYECELKKTQPAQPTVNCLSTTGTLGRSATALTA